MSQLPHVFDNSVYTINEIFINKAYTRFVKSRIDNDENSLESTKPTSVIAKIKTTDFFKKLNNRKDGIDSLSILPKNCRFIRNINGRTVIVIEDPPMLRTVKFNISLQSEVENLKNNGLLSKFGYDDFLDKCPSPPYRMQLSFPYCIYVMTFGSDQKDFISMKIFYRLHPLSGMKDYLLLTNLLNVGIDSSVCLGDRDVNRFSNLNEKTDHIINSFWANEFNNDITSSYLMYGNQKEISTILAWKYYSKVDPMFIFDVQWKQCEHDLNMVLNSNDKDISTVDNMMYSFEDMVIYENDDSRNLHVDRRYSSDSIPLFEHNERGSDYLVTGDELFIDGKKYFIYEIVHIKDEIQLSLEDEDGNVTYHDWNREFRKKIKEENIKNKEIAEIEVDGIKIKAGSILEASDGYRKKLKYVQSIRKSRDGVIELKCDKTFYFVEEGSLVGVKVFDKDNLTFANGTKIIKGNRYSIFSQTSSAVFDIQTPEFADVVISNDNINYTFVYKNPDGGKDYKFNHSEDSYDSNVSDFDEELLINSKLPVFRVGSLLLSNTDKNYSFHVIKDKGIGVTTYNGFPTDKYNFGRYCVIDHNLIKSEILKDNKLRIPSFDMDIEFDIGDTIVAADYSQPLKYITTVRTITGFRFDTQLNTKNEIISDFLYVDTIDENNNVLSIPYINFNITDNNYLFTKCPKINIGLIRKIIDTPMFKKGMRVKAKVARIPMFKKKDTYEVIGVIVDTGCKPIILCSNGHTIWCDEKSLVNFEFAGEQDKRFDKFKLTEITEDTTVESKHQSGDMIKVFDTYRSSYEEQNLIAGIGGNGRIMYRPLQSLFIWGSAYSRKISSYQRQCYQTIPMPRFLPDCEIIRQASVIPNYHGWFTFKENSIFKLTLEKI